MPETTLNNVILQVGVDDMDPFKGIELKLAAFERLLDYHSEYRGNLVLVQVRELELIQLTILAFFLLLLHQFRGSYPLGRKARDVQ